MEDGERKIKSRLKEIRTKEFKIRKKSDFAKLLGVTPHVYFKWERELNTPTLKVALLIAEKLKKNIEEIWYLE